MIHAKNSTLLAIRFILMHLLRREKGDIECQNSYRFSTFMKSASDFSSFS